MFVRIRRFARFWIFLVMAICQFPAAHGDVIHWEFAGWYGGGCYPNVEFDPNMKGRVYLVSDVAGVWRSTDSGENWSFMARGLKNLNVSFVSVAPSNSKIIYAGTAKGLFVWRESINTWEPCDSKGGEIYFVRPGSHRSLAISKSDPAMISVGTASGSVFNSVDGGLTWGILGNSKKPFKDNKPITSLVYGSFGKVLYAGSTNGLAKYSFETRNWSILGPAPSQVTDLTLGKESPDQLYVAGQNTLLISDDGGATWKQSAPVPKGSTNRVSVFNSQTGTLLAVTWVKGWTGGVVLSRDDGQTWTLADSNMPADLSNPTRAWASVSSPPTSIKISPFDPRVLIRTDWWGVWRSDDSGMSWKEKIKGAPNTVGSDIYISPTGNIYVATMDNGLTVSSNGGKTYRPLFPTAGYRKDMNGHVWRVLVFGENDTRIIATSSPWGEDVNQVILSTDAGKSFTIVRNGLPASRPKMNTLWGQGYPRALAADPQNSNLFYLGIDGDDGGGLFISRDGGATWIRSSGQPTSRKIYNALAVDPRHPSDIYWGACGEQGGVYLSKNGGETWSRVFSELLWVFDLRVATDGVVYAAGDLGGPVLYASSDRGRTWKLVKRFPGQGAAEAICIDQKDPKRIGLSVVQWEGGEGGKVYQSDDGGSLWKDITGDLPAGTGAAALAIDERANTLYAVRYAGSVYKTKLEPTASAQVPKSPIGR